MFWAVELPDGAAWHVAPGLWFADRPADRERIRTRLRAADYISALPHCPEFATAEPISAEAFAAALVAEYGDVNLPPHLADEVVPPIPSGAVA